MTDKTKRQLRAEAVERLQAIWPEKDAEEVVRAAIGRDERPGSQSIALINLLTDDEPSDGDAVGLLRKYATAEQDADDPEYVLLGKSVFGELADMVERDYVERWHFDEVAEAYEKMADLSADQAVELKAVKAERDEWKARAETGGIPAEYRERYDNLAHAHPWMREMRDAMGAGSSKVRAGSSNLEWLYLNDYTFHVVCMAFAAQHDGGKGREEWLLSEHVDEPCAESYMDGGTGEQNPRSQESDSCEPVSFKGREVTGSANGTANGTCPDAMGHASDDSGHSQTMPATNQPIGESVAPKPPETAESDAAKGDMRDFDADTREKLEADVREWHGTRFAVKPSLNMLFGWLDRQAAITAKEWREQLQFEFVGLNCGECENSLNVELQAKVDSLESALAIAQDGSDRWRGKAYVRQSKVNELTAERDYWRGQFMRCLTVAIRQEAGDDLDRLMTYPLPDGMAEPYQLVTDEIDSLRDFYAETRKAMNEAAGKWAKADAENRELWVKMDAIMELCKRPSQTHLSESSTPNA